MYLMDKIKSTIYDIARETNLSIATVSRILNRKGSYSKQSESLVLGAIERLNYYPSASARNLATKTTKTIGISISPFGKLDTKNDFHMQLFKGALVEAVNNGYDLLAFSSFDGTITANSIQNRPVDGVILSHFDGPHKKAIDQLLRYELPFVYVGRKLSADPGGHHIYGGYYEYKREVLEYLYHRGYRKITVFETFVQSAVTSSVERCRTVVGEFRAAHGLTESDCRMVVYDFSDLGQFDSLLKNILEGGNPPEAIYTDSIGACTNAYNILQKAGLRIPEDISVVSSSQFPWSGEELYPPVTTVCIHSEEMGARAVQLLLAQIGGHPETVESYIPYTIFERKSVGQRA